MAEFSIEKKRKENEKKEVRERVRNWDFGIWPCWNEHVFWSGVRMEEGREGKNEI